MTFVPNDFSKAQVYDELVQELEQAKQDADKLRAAVEYAFDVDRKTFEGLSWLRAWWSGDVEAMRELDEHLRNPT